MTDNDEQQRLSSGWGRRAATPSEASPGTTERDELPAEQAADLDEAADAGAISGRAVTNEPRPEGEDAPI